MQSLDGEHLLEYGVIYLKLLQCCGSFALMDLERYPLMILTSTKILLKHCDASDDVQICYDDLHLHVGQKHCVMDAKIPPQSRIH